MNVTPEFVSDGLRRARYITNERVETAIFLALALEKPLLIEGPAGSGKTEVAKVLAEMLGTELDSPPMLRGPRRGARALRMELSETVAAPAGR